MKNRSNARLFLIIAAILAGLFLIFTLMDFVGYKSSLNSAPFYAFVLVRAIEFLIPALIAFAAGLILKRKAR